MVMGKLKFRVHLISRFYPVRKIYKNFVWTKNRCFRVLATAIVGSLVYVPGLAKNKNRNECQTKTADDSADSCSGVVVVIVVV